MLFIILVLHIGLNARIKWKERCGFIGSSKQLISWAWYDIRSETQRNL